MFRSFSAVRSLAGDVDDLERFHHLFLPGGWRSVQSKEYIFLSLFQTAATAPPLCAFLLYSKGRIPDTDLGSSNSTLGLKRL